MVRRQPHPTQIARCGQVFAVIVAAVLVGRRASQVFRRVQVAGDSMLPTFHPGDRLLVGPPVGIGPGTVVALPDPRRPDRLIVKRVHAAEGSWVDVRGDNQAASTDSRHFGLVPRSQVTGRIVYRYGPPGRTGWWPGRTSTGPPSPGPSMTAGE